MRNADRFHWASKFHLWYDRKPFVLFYFISSEITFIHLLPQQILAHAKTGEHGYLTRAYLRQYHNRQWSKHQLFSEHFASHYRYKLNQDGMEYRYSRLWRLDDAMSQSLQNQFNSDGTRKAPNQNRFQANWMTYPWSRF